MQVFPSKDGSIQNYSATVQHFGTAKVPVVDAHQQLTFAAPKHLPVVVPVEASRVTTPLTPVFPVFEASTVVSPKSPAVDMPKVQVGSSTEPQQAIEV